MLTVINRQLMPLIDMPVTSAMTGGFSPADLTGLTLWLKGDGITGASDGDLLASWADSSGSGHSVSQSTSTKKPVTRLRY